MHPILCQVAFIHTGKGLGVGLGFTGGLQIPCLFKHPLADLCGSCQRGGIGGFGDLCPCLWEHPLFCL
jgi:hypothetical protein